MRQTKINLSKTKSGVLEDQKRETSSIYREKLSKSLIDLDGVKAFKENGFSKAINCSPALGRTFLNDCVSMDRHNVVFKNLDVVYGASIRGSALCSVLNMKTDDEDLTFEAKRECLEDVVMRHFAIVYGTIDVVFTIVGLIVVQLLRLSTLWCLARFSYERLEIPNLHTHKLWAKKCLFCLAIILTIFVSSLVLTLSYLLHLQKHLMNFNNLVLAASSFYFITNITNL
ncbi:hypothetical protein THRCLA_21029 [Thraustotheca clavata]|uniref:Uncharacterized protein n=1 Tax=Thraustotheca clavata TaxID=74557 RepID=A0A1W0A145_9STRA|nr:hypothetical protein THRCLA_21029 [Thraustotheca clavata]